MLTPTLIQPLILTRNSHRTKVVSRKGKRALLLYVGFHARHDEWVAARR